MPLMPRYVSTVDSGNLAGHLRVMAAGLDQMVNESIVPKKIFEGLYDTLDVLLEEMATITPRFGDVAKRLVGSSTSGVSNNRWRFFQVGHPTCGRRLNYCPSCKMKSINS